MCAQLRGARLIPGRFCFHAIDRPARVEMGHYWGAGVATAAESPRTPQVPGFTRAAWEGLFWNPFDTDTSGKTRQEESRRDEARPQDASLAGPPEALEWDCKCGCSLRDGLQR